MWLSSAVHNNCTINSILRPRGSPCYGGKLTLTSVTWAESPKTRYVIDSPKYLLNTQMWTHASPAAFIFFKICAGRNNFNTKAKRDEVISPILVIFQGHLIQPVFVVMLQVFKLFYAFDESKT